MAPIKVVCENQPSESVHTRSVYIFFVFHFGHAIMSFGQIDRFWMLAVVLLAVCGCSKGPSGLVPVAGKVECRGKPVAKATVTFTPDPVKNLQGRSATAQTDDAGSFQLRTPPGEGALPGVYRVTITLYPGQKTPFSSKYTRIDTTTLLVEIPQGGRDNLVLKLD